VVIQEWLSTSARLYTEKGVWHIQYHFWAIYIKKWFGADAQELLSYYTKNIKQSRSSNFSEEKEDTLKNNITDK
jgi:hypothetical protein